MNKLIKADTFSNKKVQEEANTLIKELEEAEYVDLPFDNFKVRISNFKFEVLEDNEDEENNVN